MFIKNEDFEAVLKKAQDLGYAEADPTLDVDGIDRYSSQTFNFGFHFI